VLEKRETEVRRQKAEGRRRKTGNRGQVTGDRDAETKNQNARGLFGTGRVDRMKPRSPPQISEQDGL